MVTKKVCKLAAAFVAMAAYSNLHEADALLLSKHKVQGWFSCSSRKIDASQRKNKSKESNTTPPASLEDAAVLSVEPTTDAKNTAASAATNTPSTDTVASSDSEQNSSDDNAISTEDMPDLDDLVLIEVQRLAEIVLNPDLQQKRSDVVTGKLQTRHLRAIFTPLEGESYYIDTDDLSYKYTYVIIRDKYPYQSILHSKYTYCGFEASMTVYHKKEGEVMTVGSRIEPSWQKNTDDIDLDARENLGLDSDIESGFSDYSESEDSRDSDESSETK